MVKNAVKRFLRGERRVIERHAVSALCASRTAATPSKIRPYDRRMAQPTPTRFRIDSLDTRLARLRAERSRLVARANHTERKRDTRRKILIGGAVLAAIQHEGVPALRSPDALTKWMAQRLDRPHDRAVFELPCATDATSPTP